MQVGACLNWVVVSSASMAALLSRVVNGVWRPECANGSTEAFRRVGYVAPRYERSHDVDVVFILVAGYRYLDWPIAISENELATTLWRWYCAPTH